MKSRWIVVVTLLLGAACQDPAREEDPQVSSSSDSARPVDFGPRLVSFRAPDGGEIFGDLYGAGERGVVLAHGARFDKESWSEQAQRLAKEGYRVLAIDFRGYGQSKPGDEDQDPYAGLYLDVLGAVRYLRGQGASEIAVVGGSMGGWAAAEACVASEPGEIDRLVLLASSPITSPEKLKGRKLFLIARDDPGGNGQPRLVAFRDQYERAPEPKELVVLDGAAHAQHIFKTEQGERLMREILRFLAE